MTDRPLHPSQTTQALRSFWWWTALIVVVTLMLFMLLAAAGMVYQRVLTARDALRFPPPGRLYKVGLIYLHMSCIGEGEPTIIMDSGIGSWSIFLTNLQTELSKTNRVCVYDRPGYGWSEPDPGAGMGMNTVENLHMLLRKAGINEPVLLVGHSVAGLTMKIYAKNYPLDVLGLVLIDTPHEDFIPVLEQVLSYNIDDLYPMIIFGSRLGLLRTIFRNYHGLTENVIKSDEPLYTAQMSIPSYYETVLSEKSHLLEVADLSRKAGGLGNLPFVTISARKLYVSDEVLPPELNLQEVNSRWMRLQSEIPGISKKGVGLVSTRASNNVLLNDPALAASGVRLAVSLATGKGDKAPEPRP
ncbi:MAG: alpha/beta hydrolase [Thermodesulfobacteriota bacterium]